MKRWLIIALVTVLALAGLLGACAPSEVTTPPEDGTTLPEEGTSPPRKTEVTSAEQEPSLKDLPLRLDEMPSGWYESVFEEGGGGEYTLHRVRVIFRNIRYPSGHLITESL